MNDGAFALNGISSNRHEDDNSIAWDGFALGREMYAKHHGNISDAANEWTDRAVTFWTPFFSYQVEDGEALLEIMVSTLVDFDVAGFFRNPDNPESSSDYSNRSHGRTTEVPHKVINTFLPQTEPYSSNPITMELIAGQTERAKTTLAKWLPQLKTTKEADRNWRTLQYLIQQTARYDTTVNRTVNVLEITANQRPRWLQNLTCK